MKKFAIALASAAGLSIGSGTALAETVTRPAGSFVAISASGGIEVIADAGAHAPSVALEGDAADIDRMETRIEGGVLYIRPLPGFHGTMGNITARVGAPGLEAFSGSGSVKATIAGIHTRTFTNSTAGSATVQLSGEVNHLESSSKGSATLKARELKAKSATISIAGSGEAVVWVSDALSVSIAGSGKVRYYGSPPNIARSVAGSGSIEPGR